MSSKEEQAAAARRRHNEEREAAVTIGSFEMITKGVFGAAAGFGGVQILNKVHTFS